MHGKGRSRQLYFKPKFAFEQRIKVVVSKEEAVETSVAVTNSSFQNYTHPDDHTRSKLLRILLGSNHFQRGEC